MSNPAAPGHRCCNCHKPATQEACGDFYCADCLVPIDPSVSEVLFAPLKAPD